MSDRNLEGLSERERACLAPFGGGQEAGHQFFAVLSGEEPELPPMGVGQAGIDAQGRCWWAAAGCRRQDCWVCDGTGCSADGERDGMPDSPSIRLDDRVRELSGSLVDDGFDVGRGGMMRPAGDVKVCLHREPIDMTTGRNGLAALVREGMLVDPPISGQGDSGALPAH